MLEPLLWVCALAPAALLIWFTLEVLAGLKPLTVPAAAPSAAVRTAVLIPAHDEEAGIGATLSHLGAATPDLRILVVADNCTDATVAIARQAGAEVVERTDLQRRGKGYALSYGRDHLAEASPGGPPDAVVVIDADCRTDHASIRLLAEQAVAHGGPMQARNLLTAGDDASPLTQISNFAMLVKNLVRARGLQRLGGGIPLFGTGMAFPWPLFAAAPLATDHLVEDMQLALQLARQGIPVKLVEQASVLSAAAPADAARTQRSRWERGFLGTARAHALPMLANGIGTLSHHRSALGLHLLVPPLALLLLLAGVVVVGLAIAGLLTQHWGPALFLAATLAAALAAVALAWHREGRATLPPHAAIRAPLYVLWKVPLYLGFFRKDRSGWKRTTRLGERD